MRSRDEIDVGSSVGKESGALIVVSLLFSISLAQAGKTNDSEIVVRKSGVALEQEAIKKVEPVFPPIAKAARASGAVKVEVTIDETGKWFCAPFPVIRYRVCRQPAQWKFNQQRFLASA